MVLVIGPFCSAIQAKWIGRPLTWREICSSGGLLLTVGVSGVFVVFAFLNWAKGYRDARTSEKLQLTESAIIKQVCTRI